MNPERPDPREAPTLAEIADANRYAREWKALFLRAIGIIDPWAITTWKLADAERELLRRASVPRETAPPRWDADEKCPTCGGLAWSEELSDVDGAIIWHHAVRPPQEPSAGPWKREPGMTGTMHTVTNAETGARIYADFGEREADAVCVALNALARASSQGGDK